VNRLSRDSVGLILVDHTPTSFKSFDAKNERYATLSWGLFDEEHAPKDVERYGRALLDTKTKKIIELVEHDVLYNGYPLDVGVFGWAIDPMAGSYAGISPYVAFGDNPIFFVDSDGRKIKPVNGHAVEAVEYLGKKYGQALWISHDPNSNVYGTERDFKNYNKFKSALENEIPKKEMKQAWALYQGLKDDEIIEVSILVTGEVKDNETKNNFNNKSGSSVAGAGVETNNPEYNELVDLIRDRSCLDSDLANTLYNGANLVDKNGNNVVDNNNKPITIKSNVQGKEWVYFKDYDNTHVRVGKNNVKVKGHVLIDGTKTSSTNTPFKNDNATKVTNAVSRISYE
jgi:hypothetical protein